MRLDVAVNLELASPTLLVDFERYRALCANYVALHACFVVWAGRDSGSLLGRGEGVTALGFPVTVEIPPVGWLLHAVRWMR